MLLDRHGERIGQWPRPGWYQFASGPQQTLIPVRLFRTIHQYGEEDKYRVRWADWLAPFGAQGLCPAYDIKASAFRRLCVRDATPQEVEALPASWRDAGEE